MILPPPVVWVITDTQGLCFDLINHPESTKLEPVETKLNIIPGQLFPHLLLQKRWRLPCWLFSSSTSLELCPGTENLIMYFNIKLDSLLFAFKGHCLCT